MTSCSGGGEHCFQIQHDPLRVNCWYCGLLVQLDDWQKWTIHRIGIDPDNWAREYLEHKNYKEGYYCGWYSAGQASSYADSIEALGEKIGIKLIVHKNWRGKVKAVKVDRFAHRWYIWRFGGIFEGEF